MKAVIYLPGIGYDYFDISSELYAYRYKSALDKSGRDKFKKYVTEHSKFNYGKDDRYSSNISSIIEYSDENNDKNVVCKIYEFEYSKDLTTKFNNRNIFVRSLLLFFALIKKFPKFLQVLFLRKSTLSFIQKAEIVYFGVIFICIALFGILILPSLISYLIELINAALHIWTNGNSKEIRLYVPEMLNQMVISLTAVVLVFFPKFNTSISKIATEFICLDYFLNVGEKKLDIIGKLETLIERISENEEYEFIELHGQGFGSVLILDIIYPYGNTPVLRVQDEIKNIVTIGCPYDFIKAYYPHYFENRESHKNIKLNNWYNIYSEIDVFSSNFRYDSKSEPAEISVAKNGILPENLFFNVVNPESVRFWSYMLLLGIRIHKIFWGHEPDSVNCLSNLMEKMNPEQS